MSDDTRPTRMPDGEVREMTEKRQSPSLGRIVLFRPSDGVKRENGAEEYPAIIGQVFEDANNPRPYCNLFVMPPFAASYWEGSVQETVEGERTDRTWRWPPRVA